MLTASRILSMKEVYAVFAHLRRPVKSNHINNRTNLVVFWLSCGCGLRCCEIAGLELRDVHIHGERPHIKIRKEATKGYSSKGVKKSHGREIPLWWSRKVYNAIAAWLEHRQSMGAAANDPFICTHKGGTALGRGGTGHRLCPDALALKWKQAIKCLGPRAAELSIHCGRHSFASHSLQRGRSLKEVQNALGHASIATTDKYLHLIETGGIEDVF
jgi:site-specific recombinase XerD